MLTMTTQQTQQQAIAVQAQEKMRRIGSRLLADRKAYYDITSPSSHKHSTASRLEGRDLLTLLVKANMGADVLDDQRLSDEDVIARMPTSALVHA